MLDLRLIAFGASALGAVCVTPLMPPLLRALRLERKNYRGEAITSGGGVLFVFAAIPWLWLDKDPYAAITAIPFGLLGFIDDRWGTAEFRGLRGHLKALAKGRLTTGLLKAAGGLVIAAIAGYHLHRSVYAVPACLLIALCANFLNLLDLRPLRALKVFWVASACLAGLCPPALAACVGTSLPYSGLEARRRVMLGDTGSNALGALLGYCAARILPVLGMLSGVLLLAALHVWAERYSISAWIGARPFWRKLDRLGWAGDEEE